MAKLLIPVSSLPPMSASTLSASVGLDSYFIRFRIISDDRNISSYWSNIYEISASSATVVQEPKVSISGNSVNVTWTSASAIGVNEYDIWLSWEGSSKSYVQYNVNNKVLTSSSATLTTTVNHNFEVGDIVTVAGIDTVFDGTYTLIAKTANTITYNRYYSNISSTAVSPVGTVNRQWKYYGRQATTIFGTIAENSKVSVRIYKATLTNDQNPNALLYQQLDAS